jgi:hypothetical protein
MNGESMFRNGVARGLQSPRRCFAHAEAGALLLTLAQRLASAQKAEPPPIIVKLIEPDNDPIGLANVVIGALGLSGALAVCAILLGFLLAGVLFLVRSRHPLR